MSNFRKTLKEKMYHLQKHAVRIPNTIINTPRQIISNEIHYSATKGMYWVKGIFKPTESEIYDPKYKYGIIPDEIDSGELWKYEERASKADVIIAIYELANELAKQHKHDNLSIIFGEEFKFATTENFTANRKYVLSLSITDPKHDEKPFAYAHISRKGEKVAHAIVPSIKIHNNLPRLEDII